MNLQIVQFNLESCMDMLFFVVDIMCIQLLLHAKLDNMKIF